jgi:hypothetical protein
MSVKLLVKVHTDERVEVKVEGLITKDQYRPKDQKLCKKITRRLELDLGEVTQCIYLDDGNASDFDLINPDHLKLENETL